MMVVHVLIVFKLLFKYSLSKQFVHELNFQTTADCWKNVCYLLSHMLDIVFDMRCRRRLKLGDNCMSSFLGGATLRCNQFLILIRIDVRVIHQFLESTRLNSKQQFKTLQWRTHRRMYPYEVTQLGNRKKNIFHVISFVIYLIACLPLIMSSWAVMIWCTVAHLDTNYTKSKLLFNHLAIATMSHC